MIAYLKGKIKHKKNKIIVLEVNNIGYKVHVGQRLFDELQSDAEVEFFIYKQVGEQILALYGFKNPTELEVFEILIGVSGVGPKTAINFFDVASAAEIGQSILNGDTSLVNQVSGIGKKTAERIVLETRNKLNGIGFGEVNSLVSAQSNSTGASEEVDALVALGYSAIDARSALDQIDIDDKDSGAIIREALKILSGVK